MHSTDLVSECRVLKFREILGKQRRHCFSVNETEMDGLFSETRRWWGGSSCQRFHGLNTKKPKFISLSFLVKRKGVENRTKLQNMNTICSFKFKKCEVIRRESFLKSCSSEADTTTKGLDF